jgi:ribose 1,5-bisphosphokinase PhnN
VSDGLFVVVNGSSASGKSRLIAGVERVARESAVLRGLRCARRTTTRALRDRESLPTENRHLDPAAFELEVQSGSLDVHWRRRLSSGHEIRYGFSLDAERARGGLVILSANNYLDWMAQPLLAGLRDERRLMVVRVWASRETRHLRLRARRPALAAAELGSRLDDLRPASLPPADHVIPNDAEFEPFAEWELLRLLAAFEFSSVQAGDDRGQLTVEAAS